MIEMFSLKILIFCDFRATIIKEMQKTMESHGISVDIRHLMLLADVMCQRVGGISVITCLRRLTDSQNEFRCG